ncbi:MAG: hypothetical protein FJX04_09565 [Alphaproteobacteria bacterium]|nr:hypothetical protein [Alphaproteobacteria bacterium]
MPTLLAGLDFGTGRIRAVAVDLKGSIVAEAAEPTPYHFPKPGWAENYPEDLWRSVCNVLRSLTRQTNGQLIAGLAVASVGEAAVLMGKDGKELGPVIAWYCNRSLAESRDLREKLGDDYVYSVSGVNINHTFGVSKLMWWRRHHPEVFSRAHLWLNMADWVVFRLTGEARTDYTLASRTNALDVKKLCWSKELLAKIDINSSLMAPLIASGQAVGRVHAHAAGETGLPFGMTVSAGGHDHIISTAAAETDKPGVLLNSMGTAEVQILMNETPIFDERFRRYGYQQGIFAIEKPRNYLCCGLYTSGGAVEWFRRLASGASYEALIEAANTVAPGSDGVCFLPQLRGGDQPFPNPNARAGFIGLSSDSSLGVMFRSLLEGTAMCMRLGIEGMTACDGVTPIKRFRVIGGSTRNDLWMKIKASIIGSSIEVTPLTEVTGLSAAILGGLGSGVFANLEEARQSMQEGLGKIRNVEPDPVWSAHYQELYTKVYTSLPSTLAPTHEALAHFRR